MDLKLDAALTALSYRNANYLAVASDLAYEDANLGPGKFLTQLGLTASLLSQQNAQVFFCEDASNIVLAFRGSERPTTTDGLKDWLFTNAKIRLAPPEGTSAWVAALVAAGAAARFHTGFMEGLGFLWEDLITGTRDALNKKERPIWCTGHSLGGALAILAALALARQDGQEVPIEQVYTFGAPMVGDLAAAEGISSEFRNRYFRFVNEDDLVPELPRSSFFANEYRHAGTPEILSDPGATLASVKQLLSTLKEVQNLVSGEHLLKTTGLLIELRRRLDAHSIEKGYIRRIEDRLKLESTT